MAIPAMNPPATVSAHQSGSHGKRAFNTREKPAEVRLSNIIAAKAVADVVRSSLGPRGMDKMIQTAKGELIITNDGATILKHMNVLHPCSRMLIELSNAQDVEAGDGTTSVVVLAGSLLTAAEKLLSRGIHPTTISDAFKAAASKAVSIVTAASVAVDLKDRGALLKIAATSLNSKVVSQFAGQIAAIAVDAVLAIVDPALPKNVDLRDIRIVKKVGGTVEDMELVEGVLLYQNVNKTASGPARIEKAKIAICQFQLSAPKTDMENQIVVNDYHQMDKILKEERQYLLNMCKRIKKAGANVLLVQKSILRDAVGELALHYLAKLKIMVITDVERDEIEFLAKSLGCKPIADIDSFGEEKLGTAELVEELNKDGARVVQITGIRQACKTVSILCRGANSLVLEEADRSLHDALCVIRCLIKNGALTPGGGAPEIEASVHLSSHARTLPGLDAICFEAYAEALEVIPTTLAENAGLNPIAMVTELRNRHAAGHTCIGINVRKGTLSDMVEENVLQPLLVSTSAIQLATETVTMIMKIDDIVQTR